MNKKVAQSSVVHKSCHYPILFYVIDTNVFIGSIALENERKPPRGDRRIHGRAFFSTYSTHDIY